ncbi:MAG: Holliday junction branch migration protein RuvA [Spirochaetia bacterium]|nr:Holliday junction branch migration protein RuvA [Spirochaetia bacterium]
MIAFLKGKIFDLRPLELLLDVNGVGYKINITLFDSEKLSARNTEDTIFIFTRVQYGDNSRNLFGFLNHHEAQLYDFLVSLHGIGPKIVMSILSYCQTREFIEALENENSSFLTKVPGIGKSKSEKIIFEAKGKRKKLEMIKNQLAEKSETRHSQEKDIFSELLADSLETMGFSKKEISLAEKKILSSNIEIPEISPSNIQQWVRLYLKYL